MTTSLKVLLLIGVLGGLSGATRDLRSLRYAIPQPSIQAFKPSGLRVSIPHVPGTTLFSFHANINTPIDNMSPGQVSHEVHQKNGDHWVVNDANVKLQIGDKLYYWIYVMRDNLGYRHDQRAYEIKELVSKDGEEEDQCDGTAATETPSPTLAPAKLDHNPGICEKVVWNLTQSLLDLRQESDSLRETNDILRDMVEKHPNTSKTLLLDGPMVNDDDLAVMIQAIVKDKLNLSIKVKNVNRKKNGTVSFQVGSVSEKVEVVKAAKRKLKYSSFTITY
jgi:hypothetical protein